jgi:hypothetical protein
MKDGSYAYREIDSEIQASRSNTRQLRFSLLLTTSELSRNQAYIDC